MKIPYAGMASVILVLLAVLCLAAYFGLSQQLYKTQRSFTDFQFEETTPDNTWSTAEDPEWDYTEILDGSALVVSGPDHRDLQTANIRIKSSVFDSPEERGLSVTFTGKDGSVWRSVEWSKQEEKP